MPAMFGNVKSPMPIGPVQSGGKEAKGYADSDKALEENAQIAEEYCSNHPNAMLCPSCGGTGVKLGKTKQQNG